MSNAVVLIDARLGAQLPGNALAALRSADVVLAGTQLPGEIAKALDIPVAPARLPSGDVVVIAADIADPAADALLARGADVITGQPPAGAGLLAAVAVMDRLRSPGGCPWDADQTHDSLKQYLVEETFELLEAIEDGDRPALREELGDVLLQVLFHARVAAEDTADPFTVDDVAAGLATKLIGRHPHVFAGGDPAVRDAHSQERRWEELKQAEKQRESSVDGVALGQPAVSLAAKLTQRVTRAGFPPDLLPDKADGPAGELFGLAAAIKLAGADPEGELRAYGRAFAARVRAAELAARAAGADPLAMDAAAWRAYWPA